MSQGQARTVRAALQEIAETRAETIENAPASWLEQCVEIARRALFEMGILDNWICKLEGIVRANKEALNHWRSESDRDAGKIQRLDKALQTLALSLEDERADNRRLQKRIVEFELARVADGKARGEVWRRVNAAEEELRIAKEEPEAILQRISGAIGLMNDSEHRAVIHRWWRVMSEILQNSKVRA